MKKIILYLFLSGMAEVSLGAGCGQTVFNPFTGKLDCIGTAISSSTLTAGSTLYIQNSLTPTTTSQAFSVATGLFAGSNLTSTTTVAGIDAQIQRTAGARYYTIESSTSNFTSGSYSKLQLGNGGFTPNGSARAILSEVDGPSSASGTLTLQQGQMTFADQNSEGVTYSGGTLNLQATSVSPSLTLQASGGTLGFQTPAGLASSVTWQLPAADASGCFKSDGSGNMSIATCGGSPGGSNAQLQYNDSGSFGGSTTTFYSKVINGLNYVSGSGDLSTRILQGATDGQYPVVIDNVAGTHQFVLQNSPVGGIIFGIYSIIFAPGAQLSLPGGSLAARYFQDTDISKGYFDLGLSGIAWHLSNRVATDIPMTINGAPTQSANLQEWRNSSEVTLSSVSSAGNITASTLTATTAVVFSDATRQITAASPSVSVFSGALFVGLASGTTFQAFVPTKAITLKNATFTVDVAGVGGSGDSIVCTDASGNNATVTSAAAAAAGTVTTSATSSVNISAGTTIYMRLDSGAVTKPQGNASCVYAMQ